MDAKRIHYSRKRNTKFKRVKSQPASLPTSTCEQRPFQNFSINIYDIGID